MTKGSLIPLERLLAKAGRRNRVAGSAPSEVRRSRQARQSQVFRLFSRLDFDQSIDCRQVWNSAYRLDSYGVILLNLVDIEEDARALLFYCVPNNTNPILGQKAAEPFSAPRYNHYQCLCDESILLLALALAYPFNGRLECVETFHHKNSKWPAMCAV